MRKDRKKTKILGLWKVVRELGEVGGSVLWPLLLAAGLVLWLAEVGFGNKVACVVMVELEARCVVFRDKVGRAVGAVAGLEA